MICRFIDEHKARFGVVPICRTLTEHGCAIAPRTYYAWRDRAPSKRALWDMTVTAILAGYYEPDEQGRRKPEWLYGATKMWAHLQRQGIEVARCTVERLMRANGWQGVTRRRKVRTTIADPDAVRPPDLVDRQFRVPAPNVLVVADFTYVRLIGGTFVYTAFVIDAFAGRIVGWECCASKHTQFVESAIRQAADVRSREGNPLTGNTIHHSDAGSQYTAVRFGETLMLAGLTPSVGSVGDAYDNALAETTIGLFKTEIIARRGPWRTLVQVESALAEWVDWYNHRRLHEACGDIPPVEYEQHHHRRRTAGEAPA